MIMATGIMARPIIAWAAAAPSSPAPSARRYAALGLDRSLQPSKLADHALRCLDLDGHDEPQSTFTEISYTNYLTIPDNSLTCTRKPGRLETQWEPSSDRPPPGTIICTWG